MRAVLRFFSRSRMGPILGGIGLFCWLVASIPSGAEIRPQGDLQAAYQAAMEDARVATPEEISRNLIPIVPWNDALVWESGLGRGRVLMVTWTAWPGYDHLVGGGELDLAVEVWVTAVPELRDWCRAEACPPGELTTRIEQLLGLPPGAGYDRLVELWGDPQDLFRPAPDPEIHDREAGLRFPTYLGREMVSAEHVTWYSNLIAWSYEPGGYPWTRLGYTYDWGNPETEVGLSEFIIRRGARVAVRSVTGLEDYCKTPRGG